MKMRKITSLVLTLALVLGSFSMAFAADPATAPATSAGLTDIAGATNLEAIQVCYDLGIIEGYPDGTFKPTQAVNRAEFAAMMTRALNVPASALAGYTSTTFKDTVGYGWAVPYLAFCQSKGIMIGDGFGNVMPGRTINVNEAMTMVCRVVGYTENSSMLVGTWPSKYVTLAQNLGLYDDVAATVNVDRANAAQIIYNTLTVQKVTVNADGTTTSLWKDAAKTIPATLLNTGLDSVSSEEVVTYDQDSLINLAKYIGANANVYRNDGGDGDIVAVEMLSTFLTGEYDGDGTFEADNDIDYNVGKITPASVAVPYFDNARSTDDMALDEFEGTVTIAVDLSGKTIKEIYSIADWTVTDAVVAAVGDIEDLDNQQFAGYDFTTNDDGDIDMNSFMLVGATSLSKIAEDDVVYIYTDGDFITKLAVGTAVITDKKVTENDGGDYTIGGAVYNVTDKVNVTADTTAVEVGNTINAKLDAYGDIYEAEVVEGVADMYGIVKAFAPATTFDDAKVKLYTSDDSTTTITIDGDTNIGALDASTSGILVGYGLDNDGLIDTFDFAVTCSAATLSSISVLRTDSGSYAIDKDVVVFTLNNAGTYDVMNISDVEKGVNVADVSGSAFQMILDGDYVVAMLIDAEAAGASDNGNYAVFNSDVVALDADDATIQKLTGFMDGVAVTKYTDDDNVVDVSRGAIQVWDVTTDASGTITYATTVAIDDALTAGVSTIGAINSAKTAVQIDSAWYAIADNANIYVATLSTSSKYTYALSSTASLRAGYKIYLYDTDTTELGYETIIFVK